ncbi:TetR/AcrR family transcriptional regulator [Salinibacterium hongtaonis]|uniref:TetR/AcrR family transcriptional regulator n=1 Tax=Homoserinimonas hongtaonis TaxID=2079791 RepID=UPI000D38C030|nr:TetR/AcrR family transcriptional regulator [Salinibacterium hongtaonis]AWB89073.1 TetR family transcriptional regulator [Salinibacterium hongtaonis]
MQTERRTRLDPKERRAQLVALGVAFLAEHPVESLSIEYLSATAGVSRALLFHYFGSKTGMQREIVREARDSMLRATESGPGLDPQERIHATLSLIVDFVREHRGTFYSLVRGVASGAPEVREVIEEARAVQADRVIAAFIELGYADTPLLRAALRSWVAFTEDLLVRIAVETETPSSQIVTFLERSAQAVVSVVDDLASDSVQPRAPAPGVSG